MSDVTFVEVSRLGLSLAPLRGTRTVPAAEPRLAPMPLRVARTPGGALEVLDGFKRLRRWIEEGRTEVPVVIEEGTEGPTLKARLLQANTPSRTASPMDEVRVVRSLVEENNLSPIATARHLGHKPAWVARRLALSRRLAAELAAPLDRGTLSFSLALGLSEFPKSDQVRLAETASRHRLSLAEAKAFLATWRAVPDAALREALLADPRSALPKSADQGASPLGPDAAAIEARIVAVEKALDEFPEVLPPGLTDAERRVLSARRRRLESRLAAFSASLSKESSDAHPRPTPGSPPPLEVADGRPGHRPEDRLRLKTGADRLFSF